MRLDLEGAGLDDGDVQKLDELAVPDAQGDRHAVVVVGRALEAGKAAAEAVIVDGIADGIDQVLPLHGGAVREGVFMLGIQVELPDRRIVVAGPGTDDTGDGLEIVIHLHHILIDQIADQLIGMVSRDKRVS